MAQLQPLHPGFRYGLGAISGAGEVGQVVVLSGNDTFAVNTDPAASSFGILAASCEDGDLCGVFCLGGIYETDQHTGTITAGDDLACDSTGVLRKAAEGETVLAQAISLVSGTLRFKLLR